MACNNIICYWLLIIRIKNIAFFLEKITHQHLKINRYPNKLFKIPVHWDLSHMGVLGFSSLHSWAVLHSINHVLITKYKYWKTGLKNNDNILAYPTFTFATMQITYWFLWIYNSALTSVKFACCKTLMSKPLDISSNN